MKFSILGIGYAPKEQQLEKEMWTQQNINFEFADTLLHATRCLQEREFQCIVICVEKIDPIALDSLRAVQRIPVIIMPPAYSVEQRQTYAVFGALQYAHTTGYGEDGGREAELLRRYFEEIRPTPKPLTIVSLKDLSFCLEYRSVEIRGKEVELTEKEFDILSLLIMNQRKVFTHEMIMDAVWHEDISFYSPKAITTHISNLRRKLKTAPDIPEYIKSVRGIGYKFEAPL